MADHKITDFVDPQAIESLKNLKKEMNEVRDSYVAVANELLNGLKVKVDGLGDLEKLASNLAAIQGKAAETTQRHTAAIEAQRQTVANTTNTISRQLMEQEKLNESTRDAYTRQQDVKNALNQAVSSYDSMTKRLAEITIQQNKLNEQKKAEKKAYEEGKITQEQYTESLQKIIKASQELQAEKSQLESYTKSEAKENANASSSYNAMSQELARLKKAYKELDEESRNGEIGQNMLGEIKELGAHLKDLDASMGDFQRNVGDYAIAGGSVKKELKELVLEIANLTVAYKSMSEEEQASAEGQEMKQKIQDLTEQAGVLRDAISDTNEAIKNSASDTRAFDQISEGIGLMINGFGLATGAAQMLGLSEEDLVEVQTKLQAAIAASNALKGIQNALQKQSALMQGVAIIQTKAEAAAIAIKSAAEGKGVIVTKAATVAQAAFNAVAKANPYVLLATVILGVVAAIAGLVVANKKAKKSDEEAKAAAEEHAKAVEKQREASMRFSQTVADTASSQIASLMRLRAQWKALGSDISAQKKFIEQNRDKFKELGLSVNNVTEAERVLDKNTDTVIKIIMKRAQAAAYAQAMTAAWAEAIMTIDQNKTAKYASVKAGDEKGKLHSDEFAMMHEKKMYLKDGKVTDEIADAVNSMRAEKARNQAIENQKKANETATKKCEEYAEKIGSLNGEVDKLTKQLGIASTSTRVVTGKGGGGSSSSSSSEDSKKEGKNYDELMTQALKNKKESVDLQLQLEEEGSQKWLALKKTSLRLGADLERGTAKSSNKDYLADLADTLEQGNITQEEYDRLKAKAEQEYADKVLAINEKLEDDLADAREKAAQKAIEALQEEYAVRSVAANEAYNNELNALKKKYAEELKAAGSNTAKQEEARRKYEENVAKLSEKYAVKTADNAVNMYEEILKQENLTADQREDIERKLADAKIEMEKEVTDAVIAETERQAQADKDAADKRMENAQRWLQVASDALNAINDLVGSVYDAQIEKIEEQMESEDEAAEAEQDRISELVEKKVITEEEGEARKRAAEAKTAKKKEELEKKKQELEYKQAVWEKANNVAQAAIATAMGIMQTVATMGMPAAIPFVAAAAALGAINIATIIATPIPKYAKGTDFHKGGLAIVGDAGKHEVVSYDGKMFLTPDTPTLVDMPRGAEVYPDAAKFSFDNLDVSSLATMTGKPNVIVNNDFQPIARKIDDLMYLMKVQTREQKRSADRAEFERFKIARGL